MAPIPIVVIRPELKPSRIKAMRLLGKIARAIGARQESIAAGRCQTVVFDHMTKFLAIV